MKRSRVTEHSWSVVLAPHGQNAARVVAAICVGFAAGALTGSPAMAQSSTGAAKDQRPLEEIVVTSRYREEKLQDTPIAVTAITAEDIQARAFTTSYEVAYTVPNASFRPAQAAYGNTMTAYIRGVGQYDFDQAFEPGVGVYVDDVYQPFMLGTQFDLLAVDRVEVLRGPQGTLFGRGSIGGVVRLVSKKPQGDNTGSLDVTLGSYDRIDIRGIYDFPITDNLFAQVAGASRKRDGYQDVIDFACAYPAQAGNLPVRDPSKGRNCKLGTQGGEDMGAFRGQLRWVASDNVEVILAGDVQNDHSEAKADTLVAIQYPLDLSGAVIPTSGYVLFNNEYVNHVPTAAEPWGYGIPYDNRFIPKNMYQSYATYDDAASGLTFRPTSAIQRESYSATLNWDIAESLSLTAIASYTDIKSQLSSDADASPINFQVTGGQQDFHWSTGEVRLSGRAADRLDWTVGGFYYTGSATNRQSVSFPPIPYGILRASIGFPPSLAVQCIENLPGVCVIPAPIFSNLSVNTQNIADSESYAGFAHAAFDLTDKLSINAGVRYSKDTKDVAFDNSLVTAPINIDFNHTDWRAGIDYKLTDAMLVYASAATGYRPPAYNPRPFTPDQAVAVGGEEATSYELGFKSELFDRRLRLNLAAFYTDYNKRIVPIGGTECIPPYVDPTTPGAIRDSNGNICLAITSLTSYQQLSGGEVTGAELEFEWRPLDALTISGVFGYTDWSSPEIDNCDFNEDGQPDVGITCSPRAPFVPEFNWTVGASYDFAFTGGSRLTPRVDVYGQSDICSSAVSALSCSKGYELLNVRLEWASPDGDWTVALGGTNVSDEEYYLNKFDLTLFGQNTVEGQPGRPAEWYLTLGRHF
jgi:iron complex outermembrane recepter protein